MKKIISYTILFQITIQIAINRFRRPINNTYGRAYNRDISSISDLRRQNLSSRRTITDSRDISYRLSNRRSRYTDRSDLYDRLARTGGVLRRLRKYCVGPACNGIVGNRIKRVIGIIATPKSIQRPTVIHKTTIIKSGVHDHSKNKTIIMNKEVKKKNINDNSYNGLENVVDYPGNVIRGSHRVFDYASVDGGFIEKRGSHHDHHDDRNTGVSVKQVVKLNVAPGNGITHKNHHISRTRKTYINEYPLKRAYNDDYLRGPILRRPIIDHPHPHIRNRPLNTLNDDYIRNSVPYGIGAFGGGYSGLGVDGDLSHGHVVSSGVLGVDREIGMGVIGSGVTMVGSHR